MKQLFILIAIRINDKQTQIITINHTLQKKKKLL